MITSKEKLPVQSMSVDIDLKGSDDSANPIKVTLTLTEEGRILLSTPSRTGVDLVYIHTYIGPNKQSLFHRIHESILAMGNIVDLDDALVSSPRWWLHKYQEGTTSSDAVTEDEDAETALPADYC